MALKKNKWRYSYLVINKMYYLIIDIFIGRLNN